MKKKEQKSGVWERFGEFINTTEEKRKQREKMSRKNMSVKKLVLKITAKSW